MDRTKYPRTMNLPWSESNSSDDVWWTDEDVRLHLEGREVIITEKIDGECTTIYRDGHTHARSVDSKHHPSRSTLKALAAAICYQIPEGWRICGENVYAWHSVFYTGLPSHFLVFGIYDEDNICIPWDQVEGICEMLSLHTVPVIYQGIWDTKKVREMWTGKGAFPTFVSPEEEKTCDAEGYVVRLVEHFPYDEFRTQCAKYVRANHVQTDQNWMQRQVSPNKLAE